MIRNAGGRVFDALRTLAVLQTIGAPGTIAVMHHTGMLRSRTNKWILVIVADRAMQTFLTCKRQIAG